MLLFLYQCTVSVPYTCYLFSTSKLSPCPSSCCLFSTSVRCPWPSSCCSFSTSARCPLSVPYIMLLVLGLTLILCTGRLPDNLARGIITLDIWTKTTGAIEGWKKGQHKPIDQALSVAVDRVANGAKMSSQELLHKGNPSFPLKREPIFPPKKGTHLSPTKGNPSFPQKREPIFPPKDVSMS